MLEYLFIICQHYSGERPIMRKVDVVKEITVCDRDDNIRCGDGYRVIFDGETRAVAVRQTSCLYVTKDNQKELMDEHTK